MAMGFPKKAIKALEDGCRIAGTKGAMVWVERLKFLLENPSEYRQVAEEAVQAFPPSEELWNTVLSLQPPHRQLEFLQKAVCALPTSESLWSRLVDATHLRRTRRKILQRFGHDPSTKLWALFAQPEPRTEQALKIFASVREKHLPCPLQWSNVPTMNVVLSRSWATPSAVGETCCSAKWACC